MATSSKRSINVGLFVVIGILIFVVGILTIGSMKKVFSSTITVKSIFDDVNGLKVGNNIWYSGVKIGTVKSIRFLANSQVEVMLNIEEKSQEFVRKNAKAKVSTDGLIGNKIIVIYGGTQKVPSIEDGDEIAVEKWRARKKCWPYFQKTTRTCSALRAHSKPSARISWLEKVPSECCSMTNGCTTISTRLWAR